MFQSTWVTTMDEEGVLAMQEIRTLAGMFQQILHNCKVDKDSATSFSSYYSKHEVITY